MPTRYGPLRFDGVTVDGPPDYMAARGNVLLEGLLAAGTGLPAGVEDEAEELEAAVLLVLAADYSAWLTRAG
jgi:hypothetical protein